MSDQLEYAAFCQECRGLIGVCIAKSRGLPTMLSSWAKRDLSIERMDLKSIRGLAPDKWGHAATCGALEKKTKHRREKT